MRLNILTLNEFTPLKFNSINLCPHCGHTIYSSLYMEKSHDVNAPYTFNIKNKLDEISLEHFNTFKNVWRLFYCQCKKCNESFILEGSSNLRPKIRRTMMRNFLIIKYYHEDNL